jgi:RNA polymerase sigma-70 factor (ECF subfamily)
MQGAGVSEHNERAIVYCIVPRDLAPKLHEPLRRHFHADPETVVVVERRTGERRSRLERRGDGDGVPGASARRRDRRRVHARGGRRAGERRASAMPVDPPPLPRRARAHAARLVFVERLEPSTQAAEDRDTARLLARIQAGESERFADLYVRYFDRVYRYLHVVLRDPDEAEDATQQVFTQVFEALPRYRNHGTPFRGWLFTIVRNHALNQLRREGRLELMDPAELARLTAEDQEPADVSALDWITDAELTMLMERLPLAQRQVLLLRFMLDLSHEEIAAILGRSPSQVRMQQSRALRFLHARLVSLGRASSRSERAGLVRHPRQAYVLRGRRFALMR